MKDHFSSDSDQYAKYRPSYPRELFEWINFQVDKKEAAWDCGTGNGQIAIELIKTFYAVNATDISEQQLAEAVKHEKIEYSKQPAEKTNFPNDHFNLIIVGQAVHWFNFEEFYQEVNRTLKKDGLLVITGYNRPYITPEVDEVVSHLYVDILGKFWDKERKFIDDNYSTIPFPFAEIQVPLLQNMYGWSLDHLKGYLKTWSAVKQFLKEKKYDPVDEVAEALEKAWGDRKMREVRFPILLKAGKKRIL